MVPSCQELPCPTSSLGSQKKLARAAQVVLAAGTVGHQYLYCCRTILLYCYVAVLLRCCIATSAQCFVSMIIVSPSIRAGNQGDMVKQIVDEVRSMELAATTRCMGRLAVRSGGVDGAD